MSDSLLLLSDAMLAAPLADALRQHNPGLSIISVRNREELDIAFTTIEGFDRLVAFCTETIVPARWLAAVRGPCYNIHPASPAYPGSHPASFAVYDGATRFGATVHEMAARVDSGPIVAVEWFDVPPAMGVLALEDLAGEAAAKLFWRLAPALARCDLPLPRIDERWGPRTFTKKDFRAMGEIDLAISAGEFDRRWRAFGARDPSVIRLRLHGREFVLLEGASPVPATPQGAASTGA